MESKVIRKGKSVWQCGGVIVNTPLRIRGDGCTARTTSTIITGATRDILLRALYSGTGVTVNMMMMMMVCGRRGRRFLVSDNLIK